MKLLCDTRVDLASVIGSYHTLGIVPLQRRTLHMYQITPDKAPFVGMVIAHTRPSLDEIQRRVGQAIGKSRFVWLPP